MIVISWFIRAFLNRIIQEYFAYMDKVNIPHHYKKVLIWRAEMLHY